MNGRSKFIISIATVFLSSSIAIADINDGLIAHYPFNGNANDESGNENHGFVNGATLTSDKFGNENSAYSFDGNDKVIVNSFRGFQWGEKFSVSVWFKRTGESGDFQGVINNGYGANGSWEIRMGRENSNGAMLGGGVVTSAHPETWDFVNLDASKNEWHHVVMTYDGNTLSYYLDNVQKSGSGNDRGKIIGKNTPLTIGEEGAGGDSSEYFIGLIDNIYIYDRTLSRSEIQKLYNNSGSGMCTGSDTSKKECIATYNADGTLNIPCVSVPNGFGGVTIYEADMAIIPLSSPLSFELTDARIK